MKFKAGRRVTILTACSRGSVQPYIAPGIDLLKAGFQIRLATHLIFESVIRHGDSQ